MSEPGHIRDYREPNHFWADNEIADTYLSQIGIYGFAVYMLLCRYANRQTAQCFPSIPTLADQLGVSEPTVKKALKQLVEAGLIRITRRFEETPEGKKVYKSNLYTLLAVQKKSQETGNGRAPVTGNGRTPGGGQSDCPGVGNQITQGGQECPGVGNEITQGGQECPGVGNQITQGGHPESPGVGNGVAQGGQSDYPGVGNQVAPNKANKNKAKRTREKRKPPLLPPPPPSSTEAPAQRQEEEEGSQISDFVRILARRGVFPVTAAAIARRCAAEGVGVEEVAAIADAHIAAGATPPLLAWRLKHAPLQLPAGQQRLRELLGDDPMRDEPVGLARPPNVWDQVLRVLEHSMTRATFDRWLRGTQLVERQNGTLLVAAREPAAVDWLTHRLDRVIRAAVQQVAAAPLTVRFVVESEREEPLCPS